MSISKNEKPRPEEVEIICEWKVVDGKMVGNDACDRIRFLTTYYFEKLGTDDTGWHTLFRDPEDSRYWERIYQMSYMHGGGPPALYNLSPEEAKEKYPDLFQYLTDDAALF